MKFPLWFLARTCRDEGSSLRTSPLPRNDRFRSEGQVLLRFALYTL